MRWFYPFQKVVYVSKLSQAEILEKLKAEVEEFADGGLVSKAYLGKLELGRFEIRKYRPGNRTPSPEIEGSVTQGLVTTTIEVVYKWPVMELVFYGLFALLFLIFIGQREPMRFAFLLAVYVCLYFWFVFECNRSHQHIQNWFQTLEQ
jgi:hypothetical protein